MNSYSIQIRSNGHLWTSWRLPGAARGAPQVHSKLRRVTQVRARRERQYSQRLIVHQQTQLQ